MYAGFYLLTSLISAIVALTLALILTGLQVRDLEGFEKYNRARWFLAGAFGVFGILGVAEILLGEPSGLETGGLTSTLVIFIGSLMALFVTMTVLSFIRPQVVTWKNVLLQLAVIVPLGVLLLILRLRAPEPVFRICFAVMLAAYLVQIALYTRLFLRSYRQFKEQMQSFYEEDDLVGQLHWINGTFWLALGTGIASLALIFGNLLSDSIITLLFTAVFLIIGVFFINYQRFAPIVERAVMQEAEADRSAGGGIKSLNDNRLREKIDAWIQAKGYLDSTKSVGDIAQEMGWYYQALKDYIQRTTGEDFRSWRLRLRIQEAQRLLAGQPALPISRIATLSGFNDRAHFYRCFQRITGCSPQEYRKSLKNSK